MGKGQTGCRLRELGAPFAAGTVTGLTDSELLERYKAKQTESAEAATGQPEQRDVTIGANTDGPMPGRGRKTSCATAVR
jgi:hypothetical protein